MIKGEKITLRPFKLEDAEKMCELRSDFEAIKAFAGSPFPSNIQNEKEWISTMYPHGTRTSIYFAIMDNNTGEFAGYVGARNINYINRNADVGIILLKKFRGKGFYREISFIFYNYLFNEINLHKIYSLDVADNHIALDSDKKYGFKVEGQLKEHIWQDGKYKDAVFVSLYRKDFNKRHKQ